MNLFDLNGQVALVTGGNGGIGLGMAKGLAAAGSGVVVWGTNDEKNTAAVAELESYGVPVLAQRCDVGDATAVDAAFAEAVRAMGRVDACFANAGVAAHPTHFAELDLAEWHRVTRVNLDGAMLTLRAAARHMLAEGIHGSLVGVSSLGALQGQPRQQAYGAAKAGLIALVRGLAVELGRKGIRANTILPGFVRTDMTPMLDDGPLVERVLPRIPAGRWGTSADFAALAVYLASPASAYHTGTELLVDGGYLQF